MPTLMSFVVHRLHSWESPTVWHRETRRFPAEQLESLVRCGVLAAAPDPEEGPPPGGGPFVRYCRTARGLFAVAIDEDDYFEPYPLTDEDVRVYDVRLSGLVRRIRQDNGIVGGLDAADGRLISLGEKQVSGLGAIDVHLSLPNSDRESFTSRCLALRKPSGVRRVAVLVPISVPLPASQRELLDGRDITLIPMLPSADEGHLRIDWNNSLVASASAIRTDGVYPPRTIVFRGLEYACELTKAEMTFLDIALRSEEVDIGAVYSRKGPVWRGTFNNTKPTRDKITQFLSRLNRKLIEATPPIPLGFSLARGRQTITRT